jgi:drug/metabolite transporter superfamily protein YnfA
VDYTYSYDSLSSADSGIAAIGITFIIVYALFAIALYVVISLFMMKIFKKLNLKNPWAAFIPIYGQIKFLQAGDVEPTKILWILLPIAGSIIVLVYSCIAAYHINEKFGKEPGAWLAMYILIGLLWIILLSLKSAQPVSSAGQAVPADTATPQPQPPVV